MRLMIPVMAVALLLPAYPAEHQRKPRVPIDPDLPEATQPERTMVWVDHSTRKFYRKGHPHYGKGKSGEFMDEKDAAKAGFRPARRRLVGRASARAPVSTGAGRRTESPGASTSRAFPKTVKHPR